MRELTEAEKEALKATYSWVDTHNNTKYQIYTIGFSNGLETQDSRIAELEQQLKDAKTTIKQLRYAVKKKYE